MMFEIIAGIILIFFLFYKWCNNKHQYWEKNNVKYIKPVFFLGNIKDLLLLRKHVGDMYNEFYNEYPNEPAVGIYKLLKPQLVLRDPELVKTVCVKEFNSFHDNEFEINPDVEPLFSKNPFLATGERWKTLRSLHTQSQSSSKLKGMFPLMLDVCKDMSKFLHENENVPIEAKYFCGQYTTDVVASCVYGLKTNSFTDPQAEFRKMSAKLFQNTTYLNIMFLIASVAPKISNLLKLSFVSKEVSNFFIKVVADLCEYRKNNKVNRADFLQTLLDENLKSEVPKYSFQEITAHTMTFFVDGYETSSTLMSFVIYLLSLYPEYQDRVRNEIENLEEITYEDVHSLKYLDAIINETLRMYPPGLVLSRLCTQDITLKAGDKTYPIKKGMTVGIPVFSLHKNPTDFPEPNQFSPDRFYEKQFPPSFLPFGMGPRACLGSRFALTQVKTGLVYLIKHYKFSPRDDDAKLPTIDADAAFLMPPKSGLWVKFEALKK